MISTLFFSYLKIKSVRDYIDFIVILFLLLLNGVIGFVEERRAGDAIAALKSTLAQQAMVCRDNRWYTIEAAELVPGDLIRLCIGDLIPADCLLHQGKKLEVDQSGKKKKKFFFYIFFYFLFFFFSLFSLFSRCYWWITSCFQKIKGACFLWIYCQIWWNDCSC